MGYRLQHSPTVAGPGVRAALRHQHGPQVAAQTPEICMALMATVVTDIRIDPGCYIGSQTQMWPSAVAQTQKTPWPRVAGQATGCSMAPDSNKATGCSPDPRATEWPLMATWAAHFNADPGCGRAIDLDMVLGSNLDLDVTLAPCSGTGHPDW
ncbi:hypothetical protein STEG23_010009 [Scotinomys teguina]